MPRRQHLPLDAVRAQKDRTEVLAEFDVDPSRIVVGTAGRLDHGKGLGTFLQAAALVISRVPQAHFLVMGYPDVEAYRRKARRLGLEEHASFPGRIDYDQAPRYLALGDVAVGPKLSETESNGKLYNYMACALPTVAFDTPSSREILGDLGVYAPRGDVAALADPPGSGSAHQTSRPVSRRSPGRIPLRPGEHPGGGAHRTGHQHRLAAGGELRRQIGMAGAKGPGSPLAMHTQGPRPARIVPRGVSASRDRRGGPAGRQGRWPLRRRPGSCRRPRSGQWACRRNRC